MTNNDILRRIRYALRLDNPELIRLFTLGGHALTTHDLDLLLRDETDPAGIDCPDALILAFLDGLVIARRGPRDRVHEPDRLDNNAILRKLRIALKLQDLDLQRILRAGGMDVSKAELSALFRSPGHRNFKPCRDQLLRKFLHGMSRTSREENA